MHEEVHERDTLGNSNGYDSSMKFFLICSVLLVALLLTMCGTGTSRHTSRLSPVAIASIRNGVTHKSEVFALLGSPREVVTQVPIRPLAGTPPLAAKYTSSELWHYRETTPDKAIAGSTELTYFVTVFFDERGVVLECETETHR